MAFTATLSADGQTSEFTSVGGVGVGVSGTFGGGTLTLQRKKVDGAFTDIVGSGKTAADDYVADLADLSGGVRYRFNLVGSTTPDIDIEVRGGLVKPV